MAGPITVVAGNGTRTIANTRAPNPTFSSAITLNHDLIIVNSSAANSGTGMAMTGGITGTGNVIVNGNSNATLQAVNFSSGAINNVGIFTNQGTGSRATTIRSNIGSNVTDIVQNSTTSSLILSGQSRRPSKVSRRNGG